MPILYGISISSYSSGPGDISSRVLVASNREKSPEQNVFQKHAAWLAFSLMPSVLAMPKLHSHHRTRDFAQVKAALQTHELAALTGFYVRWAAQQAVTL